MAEEPRGAGCASAGLGPFGNKKQRSAAKEERGFDGSAQSSVVYVRGIGLFGQTRRSGQASQICDPGRWIRLEGPGEP